MILHKLDVPANPVIIFTATTGELAVPTTSQ